MNKGYIKIKFEDHEAEVMELINSKYKILEHLDGFSFSSSFCTLSYVFLVENKNGKKEVAKFLTNHIKKDYPDLLKQEAKRLEKVSKHPNVVEFHDLLEEKVLLMEYCDAPNLYDKIKKERYLDQSSLIDFTKTMIETLNYGHEIEVIHRDVKPSNILLGDKLKIIDYGLTDEMEKNANKNNEIIGTYCYLAPEIIKGGKHTPSSDFYSLGLVLHSLLTKKPFRNSSNFESKYKSKHFEIMEIEYLRQIEKTKFINPLKETVKDFISVTPEKRLEGLTKMDNFDFIIF